MWYFFTTNEQAAIYTAYKALKPSGVCLTSEPEKGHAKHSKSISAAKKYDITEKDMLPKKVTKIGGKSRVSSIESVSSL